MLAVQEIKAVLNEVKRAVVTFLLNLLAPPNNVDVLQVKNKGTVYLNFNVQVLVSGTQQGPCGMTDMTHAVPCMCCHPCQSWMRHRIHVLVPQGCRSLS